jgi:hypothetical protein
MKCLWVLLCALLCCAGCASDATKGQWDEFWKDVRGDNMKMRNDFSGPRGLEDQSGRVTACN